MLKGRHAQAMTELVIILPALLVLFTGIYQLSLLGLDKIKLAMLEREIMMYLTSEDKQDGWQEFGKKTAVKIGLNPKQLEVTGKSAGDNAAGLGPVSAAAGMEIKLVYESRLVPAFKAISGKEAVELHTKLVSAAGGCMKMKLAGGITDAFGKMPGGGSAEETGEKLRRAEKERVKHR